MFGLDQISNIVSHNGFVSVEDTAGYGAIVARICASDVEESGIEHYAVNEALSNLKPGEVLKIVSVIGHEEEFANTGVRTPQLLKVGAISERLFLSIERNVGLFERIGRGLGIKSKNKFASASRYAEWFRKYGENPTEEELNELFLTSGTRLEQVSEGLTDGLNWYGFVRVFRPSYIELEHDQIAQIKLLLPDGCTITTSVSVETDAKTSLVLKQKESQRAQLNDLSCMEQAADLAQIQSELLKTSEKVYKAELLVRVKARTLKELKAGLEQTARALAVLGDTAIETFGCVDALQSSQLCGGQGETFRLLARDLHSYLPIYSYNGSAQSNGTTNVTLHRRDGTLFRHDLFDPRNAANNIVINGKTGSGKSVLANLLSSALIADPEVDIFKVDVGGSYAKECQLAGGRMHTFGLNEQSGLDPVAAIMGDATHEQLAIVGDFIEGLLLDEGEMNLKKAQKAELEEQIKRYIDSNPERSTKGLLRAIDIDGRSVIARRWLNGPLANTFEGGRQKAESSSYVYYNFSGLQGASNSDYSGAVFSAVMAEINLKLTTARAQGRKIALIIDESPFFIKKAGRHFKLTTANFRKFGHITCLIGQQFSDFHLESVGGRIDYGILNNSPVRFIHSIDGDVDHFKEVMGLSGDDIEKIRNLYRGPEFREVLLQNEHGTKTLMVKLTAEEYMQVTSSRKDNEKIEKLQKAVPGLGLEEAIRCLRV